MAIGKTYPSLVKLSWDNQSLFQTNQWNWFVHSDLKRKTDFQMSQHLSLDRPFHIEVVLDSRLGYFNSVTKSFHFKGSIMPAFYLRFEFQVQWRQLDLIIYFHIIHELKKCFKGLTFLKGCLRFWAICICIIAKNRKYIADGPYSSTDSRSAMNM